MSLDITLERIDRIYRPGDKVKGNVVVQNKGGFAHSGMTIQMTGTVTLQLSAKSVGLFEAFYNSLKPITMVDYTVTIEKSGKVPDGTAEYPFEFDLQPLEGQELFETYHGVYVNITYSLKSELIRKFIGKNFTRQIEFIVELPAGLKVDLKPEAFTISPENIEPNSKKVPTKEIKGFPEFEIVGIVNGTKCCITNAFEGALTLKHCGESIKCIELQLVRVETCGCADGFAKEATEIQNIQIGDGDVPCNLEVPIYMIFPRLFTCPSVAARTFKVDFEVNIVLMFPDGRLVSKKFPLILVR